MGPNPIVLLRCLGLIAWGEREEMCLHVEFYPNKISLVEKKCISE